jgi:hypothetical protein
MPAIRSKTSSNIGSLLGIAAAALLYAIGMALWRAALRKLAM